MQNRIVPKWRPSLALVLGCTLGAVLCLPVLGLLMLRWWGPVMGYGSTMMALSVGSGFLTISIGYVLWRILLRPIQSMATRAVDIRIGKSGALEPLAHYGTSEMRALGQAILDMGASLQNRAAGLSAYTDHVTHELKSPLTSIAGAAELLTADITAKDHAKLVASIAQSAARMEMQIDGLRDLSTARHEAGRGKCMLSHVAELGLAKMDVMVKRDGMIPMSERGLTAVLIQLGQNAAQHGACEFELEWSGQVLRVSDNGRGISDGNRARIFDPFFTTTRAIGGTGLGLSIVRNMLESIGASIDLVPSENGTVFEIGFSV